VSGPKDMGGAPVAIASTRHEELGAIKSLVPAHQFRMNLNRPPPFDKEEVGPTQPQTGAVMVSPATSHDARLYLYDHKHVIRPMKIPSLLGRINAEMKLIH